MAETEIKFNELSVGDKFKFENKVWVKVKQKKKSCCTKTHNAELVGSSKVRKTLRQQVVKKITED